jgi:dihydrofolate reductase
MIAIVAADSAWGIGKDGRLPWRLPGDLAYFKEKTLGHTVVMGRRTFESLPGVGSGRGCGVTGDPPAPLPGRDIIVLTRNGSYRAAGARVVNSVGDILAIAAETGGADVYVCGGAEIYRLLLPYCDRCLVTRVDGDFGCDAFFPDLDAESSCARAPDSPVPDVQSARPAGRTPSASGSWTLCSESAPVTENGITYRFLEYSAG